MAVIPTGDIFKTLTLDGVSSKDYSVYITGEAVFNSPARDVEMITIPGRNGSFALDKGRFENIEVTYPAGIAADTEAEFREAISDFRNFLASRNGYVRLEDDYNPNEYRLAVYKSGLDVTPAQLRAGEFDITFDCKPQRYLKSGEDAIAVDSGDVVSNPTLFASSPIIQVDGYGDITIGDNTVQVYESGVIGSYQASPTITRTGSKLNVSMERKPIHTGDWIDILADQDTIRGPVQWRQSITPASGVTITNVSATIVNEYVGNVSWEAYVDVDGTIVVQTTMGALTYAYGTPDSMTNQANIVIEGTSVGGNFRDSFSCSYSINYDGDFDISVNTKSAAVIGHWNLNEQITVSHIYINSTAQVLGIISIDCDYGEAYASAGSLEYNVSEYVSIGAVLPELDVGDTEITYDNTFTDVKIVPRWWKV